MGSLTIKRGGVKWDNGATVWTGAIDADALWKLKAGTTEVLTVTGAGAINIPGTLAATGNVTISNAGSSPRFEVRSTAPTAASYPAVYVTNYNNGQAGFPVVELLQSRGTLASPTAVQANDILGSFNAWGYTGTAFRAGSRFETFAATTWGTSTGTRRGRLKCS